MENRNVVKKYFSENGKVDLIQGKKWNNEWDGMRAFLKGKSLREGRGH